MTLITTITRPFAIVAQHFDQRQLQQLQKEHSLAQQGVEYRRGGCTAVGGLVFPFSKHVSAKQAETIIEEKSQVMQTVQSRIQKRSLKYGLGRAA